jgi:hypothetical protein
MTLDRAILRPEYDGSDLYDLLDPVSALLTGQNTQPALLAGAMSVAGPSTLSSLAATSDGSFGGDVGVVGSLTGGSLVTAGIATIGGNATIGGTLNVTGLLSANGINAASNVAVSGTVNVTGATSLTTLSTSGLAAFGGNVTVAGTLGVTGVLTANTNASVGGSLTVSAGLTVSSGGASISGNSTITGTLTMSGQLTVSAGGAAITGNSTITGTLNVTALLTAAAGLSITTAGLTVVAGGVTVTAGGVIVNAGGVTNTQSSDTASGGFRTLRLGGSSSIALYQGSDDNSYLQNSSGSFINFRTAGHWVPGADGSQNLGEVAHRWGTVYATVGTINTSSREAKTRIAPFPPALALQIALATNLVTFRYQQLPDFPMAGFIAEDAPHELLSPDRASAHPQTLAAIALGAVQALAARITALEALRA